MIYHIKLAFLVKVNINFRSLEDCIDAFTILIL